MGQIELRDLSFRYPGSKKYALDGISLSIAPSSFVVLCGRSGCGKSTLLRHLKKNLTPYGERKGGAFYDGTDITELSDRVSAQQIGFVQQSPENQIVTDKVWHELAFGLESLGFPNRVIRRRVAEMASFFGIQSWFRKSVYELSGGQKQLLNLASIMAMQPEVLILDEPTSQLDPIASSEFLDTLVKINRELGTTILLSEHRLEEVFPLADQVVVMEEGKLLTCGTPRKVGAFLSENSSGRRMYTGLPAVMRVYAELPLGGECPLTVRDGRLWLQQHFHNRPAAVEEKPPKEKRIHRESKTEPAAVEFSDVWFRYQKNGNDILRGLSFRVEKGEFFCMVGGNGVGKSTALKLVSGALKPYRGKVLLNGQPGKKGISVGMLPQNPQALFTEITAEEELYDMVLFEKIPEPEKIDRVNRMLERLELTGLRKVNPYDLSGGEQQRLALGKILMMRPSLLVLDEPTKGLDPFLKQEFARILRQLKTEGVTILMVTHDIEFCAEYADRCAMMFDGDLVSADGPRAFFSGNSFYTTAANRMSRGIFEGAVTCADVVEQCKKAMI
ncbi:MAG: ABC transporter ATP-binding protein [Oscillospiraceae bacterium]|jgi:energy-coupling factor transporter ATP-binding protein EcfA2